jgi:signal transduction histidine kinase
MSSNVRIDSARRNHLSGDLGDPLCAHDDPPAGGLAAAVAPLASRSMATAAAVHPLGAMWVDLTRRRQARLVDAALAAAAFVVALTLVARHLGPVQPERGQLDWLSGALIGCSAVPLVAWRRAPRTIFVVTASASVLLVALGYSIGLPVGAAVALYLVVGSRDATDPWTRRDTATAIALFAAYLGTSAIVEREFPWSQLLHAGLAWALAWFAGERTRLRRERLAALEERARLADHELERERRLASAEERARIARDLHDSVGHAINVIVVRAGAARVRHDQDPERSRSALEGIEEIARQTAAEIDQIVGALREPEWGNGMTTAPLGVASLESLTAQHAEDGLEVVVVTAGSSRRLRPAVDLAAYRILQEALTNAARHGTGPAHVELAFGESALDVAITNPMRSAGGPWASGGHGLIGMRERATLLGGSFESDRRDGTFCVRARLPYRGGHA